MSKSAVTGSYVFTNEKVKTLSFDLAENVSTPTTIYTLDTTKNYDISYSIVRKTPQDLATAFNDPYYRLSGPVRKTLIQPDGKLAVIGQFLYTDFTLSPLMTRFNSDYTIDTEFINNIASRMNTVDTATDIIQQSDGKLIFSTNTFIARFSSNGIEDTAFSTNVANKFVDGAWCLALQSDGKILVGGISVDYNGISGKSFLIRLNSDGTEDAAFNANILGKFNDGIYKIVVQNDGKILVGGMFTDYGGSTGKSYLVRLNSDGTEDILFNNNISVKFEAMVLSIAIQNDNKILVSGVFQDYGGTSGKSHLVRLNSDGTEDAVFNANILEKFNSNIDSVIYLNGSIVVLGIFTNYDSQTGKSYLIKLNSDGTEDIEFSANMFYNGVWKLKDPGASVLTHTLAVDSFNKIYVCLSTSSSIDGKYLYNSGKYGTWIIKLNFDGTEDISFVNMLSKFSATPNKIVEQSDGKIIIAGSHSAYNAQKGKNNLIRLNSDGTEDTTFSTNAVITGTNPRFNSTIYDTIVLSDGKILVGGSFTNYSLQTGKNRLIKLNSNGTEDTTFSTNAISGAKFNNTIRALAEQSDGKILVGGLFTNYGGSTGKSYLIRLNSDGTEDTTFSTNAVVNGTTAKFNSPIRSIFQQADGKLLIAGEFINYNSQTGKNSLIRLNSDGTEDTTFSTNAVVNGTTAKFNNYISKCLIQTDGKILATGQFSHYNSQTGISYLIRLNSDGTEDTQFSSTAVLNKYGQLLPGISQQLDGKLLIGSKRLNLDGTEDVGFTKYYTYPQTFASTASFFGLKYSKRIYSTTPIIYEGNTYSRVSRLDYDLKSDRGLLQSLAYTGALNFSTPVVVPNTYNSTGISLTFNTDGTIKYTSTFAYDAPNTSRTLNLTLREI